MFLYYFKILICVFLFYILVIMDYVGLKLKFCFESRFKINFFMLRYNIDIVYIFIFFLFIEE